MKNLLLSLVACSLLTVPAFAGVNHPQQSPSAPATQPADKTPPSYDMKPQSLLDLDGMHKQYVALATAIPQEKYSYRPAEGVRSIAEVFLHVSTANYTIPTLMGTGLPAGFDPKTFEKSSTDKAQLIAAMTNADVIKPLPKLGPDANYGDVVYLVVTRAHEHLGQSIACARVNGI